ncbi:MAG: Spy/CpxP family protein refolding chaperone [Desulfovibrionaceae bacterium]|nr:Spy/CpxP family protein refolding chaperone [Desulfovibrionaceae bacterium]
MNTKNISIAAMAAFLILGMTAMAFAAPGQGRNGRGAGLNSKGVYSQLTPEKQKAVDAIYDKYDGKFDSLRTQLWTKHSTLQALINGGNADEKKIGGLIADINELRDQMRDTREAMRADLEKETGLVCFGPRLGQDRGLGMGPDQGRGPGMGYKRGYGKGFNRGPGQGMGFNQGGCNAAGPCWN